MRLPLRATVPVLLVLTRRLALVAVPLALLLATPLLAQPHPPSPEAAYAEAYALYDARLFEEASRAFQRFSTAYPDHPRTPDALFFAGEAALAGGDAAAAADLLGQFRRRYPAHPLAPRARLALGEFYFAEGRYDEAITALNEALTEPQPEEDAARALLLIGQAALRQGRTDAALVTLRRIPEEHPRSAVAARALYAIGYAEAERGEWAAAADAFERLTRRYRRTPEQEAIGLGLAEAYVRTGQYRRAVEELERRLPGTAGEQRERAQFLLGEAHLRLSEFDTAAEHFEAVGTTGPYARRARFGLGRIAFERGQWAEAADHFGAVWRWQEEVDELAAEATYLEGLALKRAGQLDEAARRLAAVPIRRPESAFADAALIERGVLLYGIRRWEEAAEAFEQLLQRYPNSAFAGEAARMLGETYAALGDYRGAERAYEQAERLGTASEELGVEVAFQRGYDAYTRAQYAEAAERLEAIYRDDPNGPRAGEALFWAAESQFQRGQAGTAAAFDAAQRLFQEFLQRFPEHRQRDAARYALAWTHFRRGDYASAATAFERFLAAYRPTDELVPYTADARLRLADSYLALRRFDEAVAAYSRVAGPGSDYAAFQTGQAQAGAGRLAEALAAFDRLLQQYPESPLRAQAQFQKGALAFQQEQYQRAITEYEQVLDQYPDSPVAAKAQYGIGDALYNMGRIREAEAAYRAVLDRYPNSPLVTDALSGVQFALAAQGEDQRLNEIVQQYAQQNPEAGALDELRFRQAEGTFQSGDLAAAIAEFEAFLRTNTDDSLSPAALLYLGRAYTDLGRPDAAERTLRQILDRYPDQPLSTEAAGYLADLYLQEQRYADALALYRQLGAEAPTPEEGAAARMGEARALLGLGQAAEAEALLEAVVADEPESVRGARARLLLAEALLQQDRPNEAEAVYRPLAQNEGGEAGAEAAVRLGTLLLEREPRRAVQFLRPLVSEGTYAGYPEQEAQMLLTVARAFRRLGETGFADEAYQLVRDQYPETTAAETAAREQAGG